MKLLVKLSETINGRDNGTVDYEIDYNHTEGSELEVSKQLIDELEYSLLHSLTNFLYNPDLAEHGGKITVDIKMLDD